MSAAAALYDTCVTAVCWMIAQSDGLLEVRANGKNNEGRGEIRGK